ncbi:hypothetical protein BDFB_010832 [Asbolus verrucosus]|uniref:Uncharacterized protein n=1 Tax=Asbolus verrucosus TaxID=1661398 RepID=A0A482W390_ASBVE|nr:hypothetical protein BDFB_010832 [Asbolus verrucosus]
MGVGHPHHHCEIIEAHSGPPVMPHYFLLPLIFLGGAVFFSVIIVVLLVVIARVRLTPVVLAREHFEDFTVENTVARALNYFTQLNNRIG